MLICELFGTPSHRIMKSIASSGKSMFIDFSRGYTNTIVKFSASIKYKKINTDCQAWLHGNTLTSPNNPNSNCSWIITKAFGSYITLDFIFMEVKSMNIIAKLWYILKFAYS